MRAVHLFSFFLSLFLSSAMQPCAVTRQVLCLKWPPVVRKFSGNDLLRFIFKHNCDLPPAFLQGRLRGQSVLAVGCHSSVLMLEWHINCKCKA